jgi:hypothetical protein
VRRVDALREHGVRDVLHYARSATVAEVSSPSRPGGFVPALIVTDSGQHPLRLDVIFG